MSYTYLKSSSAVIAMTACLVTAMSSHAQFNSKAQSVTKSQKARSGQITVQSQTQIRVGNEPMSANTRILSSQTSMMDEMLKFHRLGTYEINVPAGKIFAAQLGADDLDYWFVDAATGSASAKKTLAARPGPTLFRPGQPLQVSRASVTIKLNASEGIYLTSKVAGVKPKYQTSFTGSASANSLSNWLAKGSANETRAFDTLRGSNNGAQLSGLHRNQMQPNARALTDLTRVSVDNWASSAQMLFKEDLTLAHQRFMNSLGFFYDVSGVDTSDLVAMNTAMQKASDGTLPLRPWVAQMEQLAAEFELKAKADAGSLENTMTNAPFPKSDFADRLKECLSIEGFVTGFTSEIPFLGENKDTANDKNDPFTKPPRRSKGQTGTAEQQIDYWDEKAENAEAESARWEGCMSSIVGEEPVVVTPDISEDDYMDIIERATLLGEARKQKVDNIMDYIDTFSEFWEARYGEAEGQGVPGQGPRYTPKKWLGAVPKAEEILKEMTNTADLTGVTLTHQQRQVQRRFSPLSLTVSSPTACNNPTFDIQFNIAGLGVILGTPWNDRIQGNDTAGTYEFIAGLGGDDCINGRDGHEFILGLAGRDEIHGGDGHEILVGGGADDTIYAGHGQDYSVAIGTTGRKLRFYIGSLISGSRGSDTLFGNDPNNTPNPQFPLVEGYSSLFFGDGLDGFNPALSGDDTINIQGGISIALGQRGNDTMTSTKGGRLSVLDISGTVGAPIKFGSFFIGQSGEDNITGSPHKDFILGNQNRDTLSGGAEMDLVFGGKEGDVISGNKGIDFLFGGDGNDRINGDENEDLIVGWHGNDTLHGGPGLIDGIFGMTGNDDVYGDGGSDLVMGNRGQDVVEGGAGIDLIFGNHDNDTLRGNEGIDLVLGNGGNDHAEGGAGIDLVVGFDGLDTLRGNGGIDVMLGLERSDLMYGDGGIDIMFGGGHDDIAYGGDDLDFMVGWTGSDCLFGQNGTDLILGNWASDYLSGGNGTDILLGGDSNDHLIGDDGFDILLGNKGEDNLYGAGGTDLLLGQKGSDYIDGGAGADIMFGGFDNDMFLGGSGFDFGAGYKGNDHYQMTEFGMGGAGIDRFAYTQPDAGYFAALGGDQVDHMTVSTANIAGLSGNDKGDRMRVTGSFSAVAVFGNTGEDHISAPGGNGSGMFLAFGNRDKDTILGSKSKSFIFGNRDDDQLSAYDSDTPEARDYIFGNRGKDNMFGNSNKKDRLFGGWGKDKKTRDSTGINVLLPEMATITPHNLPFGTGDIVCRQQNGRPKTGAKRE